MELTDILARSGGLRSIARELGLSEDQVTTGAAALAPAILGGFKKQAQAQPAGVAGLDDLLGRLGGGSLLDDVLAPEPTPTSRGNEVLGTIFGSKDVSRAVAQKASTQTGLEPSLLKKMLPMVAMLVAGYIAKKSPSDEAAQPTSSGGGLGGLIGRLASRSGEIGRDSGTGFASMLDLDGDANPLDDILRMVGRTTR